jgi:ribonuclease BN (tRNA processing enzyme)
MDLAPLVQAGDTLLVEVSFGPGPVPVDALHLDGPSIAELARATGPGRILLTHLQMGYDRTATLESIRSAYEGPVDFVSPGDELEV